MVILYATAPSRYLLTYQIGVIKSVLTTSRSGKIRRHMQPYVSLALWGAWDLEFRGHKECDQQYKEGSLYSRWPTIAAH